jgi:hypothetical protein
VVIDDLDRDWVDERLGNDLIRCLFRTVLDLKRVRNLKILVGLRTNIFEELRFGRTGGQEEKFRSLVLNMRWNAAELEAMLNERVRAAAVLSGVNFTGLKDLLPPRNKTRGDAIDFILQRTLLRPRDAISYLNECLAAAGGKSRLTWDTIQGAEKDYSRKRLLALRDEWKLNYPDIDRVFHCFRGVSERMTISELDERLDDVMLLLSDGSFGGLRWLMDLSRAMWEGTENDAGWRSVYGPLATLLYSFGFIGFFRASGPSVYVTSESTSAVEADLPNAAGFAVHPAYRRALEINGASVR